MSKQTRKKSSKAPARKATSAASKTAVKTSVGKTISKPAGKAVAKPAGKSATKTGKTAAAASQKAAAKPLTIARPRQPVATKAAVAKASVAAPTAPRAAAKPPAIKTLKAKAPPPQSSGELTEGAKAPNFALPRDGGETLTLASFSGRKLVIFFFPRADTPGCTRDAIDFTRLAPAFEASGASVLGVSADPLKAQESFRDKHQLKTPLLSDETHAMLEAYGAWGEKSMYGRIFQGVLRTTVAIGADGRIAKIWRGVKVDGHADEVLAFIQSL
jgi:peroxiredoxin Q/BCP